MKMMETVKKKRQTKLTVYLTELSFEDERDHSRVIIECSGDNNVHCYNYARMELGEDPQLNDEVGIFIYKVIEHAFNKVNTTPFSEHVHDTNYV